MDKKEYMNEHPHAGGAGRHIEDQPAEWHATKSVQPVRKPEQSTGKKSFSRLISRFRGWIQAAATLLTNIHLPNFLKGRIYQGKGKMACVPGLNCYSCPAASGACPIGAFQAVVGSSSFRFSYYITGFLILLGVLLGRFICGFLCPFGWFQELLHKIPGKKLSTKKWKPLTYVKYFVLLFMVVLLPAFMVNDLGMGDPFFCKYLCPQGVLEGAIPLSIASTGIRSALGALFRWKLLILIVVVILSILIYRPFCKWICPLGAFYALMNRVSLLTIEADAHTCISCGKCAKVCEMDVEILNAPNHAECIRCGKCISACPTDALHFRYGFGKPKEKQKVKVRQCRNSVTGRIAVERNGIKNEEIKNEKNRNPRPHVCDDAGACGVQWCCKYEQRSE